MATDWGATQEALCTQTARAEAGGLPAAHRMTDWGFSGTQVSSQPSWPAGAVVWVSPGAVWWVTQREAVPRSPVAPGRDQEFRCPEASSWGAPPRGTSHPHTTAQKEAWVLAAASTCPKAPGESSITKMSTQPGTVKQLGRRHTTEGSPKFNS